MNCGCRYRYTGAKNVDTVKMKVKNNQWSMCGFIAQLVEHRTCIAEVNLFESRSVKPWFLVQASFFQLLELENLLRWSFFTFVTRYKNLRHKHLSHLYSAWNEKKEFKEWYLKIWTLDFSNSLRIYQRFFAFISLFSP